MAEDHLSPSSYNQNELKTNQFYQILNDLTHKSNTAVSDCFAGNINNQQLKHKLQSYAADYIQKLAHI